MANNIYGYIDDDSMTSNEPSLVFGLNHGVTKLIKWEWNPNGGKDGAEQEALDIVFDINGKEISYRQFPLTRAYDSNNNEVTDPSHPAFIKAIKEFNSNIVHILSALVPKEQIKQALSQPMSNFKQFCQVTASILPSDYKTRVLDVFGQYQWQVTGDNNRTYVRLPKNVKHGKWICATVTPVGEWKEDRSGGGLKYVDNDGNIHPFKRTKWFMSSNFATQQTEDLDDVPEVDVSALSNSGGVDWD